MEEHKITLESLDAKIKDHPQDTELYLERGKLHYAANEFGKAMNDFFKVRELDPSSTEAEQYLRMINEILEFRHNDQFNP